MSYNRKELKVQGAKGKKKNPFKDDVIYDPMGQWKYPGQITKIPSGDITMQGVPYPVLGVDNLGYSQLMLPDMNYNFPGSTVTEIPIAQNGGDYNMQKALELGYKPDDGNHWPSVDSETGMWLKSKKHPTAWMEFMHGQLSPEIANYNNVVVNPEGYFGDNQLQYVPKKQKGGWLKKYQLAGEKEKVYKDYQNRLQEEYKNYLGYKYRPKLSEEALAEGADATSNCIGGACYFQREMGVNIPEISGNSTFWEAAEKNEIPIKVYATSRNKNFKELWDAVQPGDFIGHDLRGRGSRNGYYPEHSQVFLKWTSNKLTGKKEAVLMDAWAGPDNSFKAKKVPYSELINPNNKTFFAGRPTKINGIDIIPEGSILEEDAWYRKKVDPEKLENLNYPEWIKEKDLELNKWQEKKLEKITQTLNDRKKDFIATTGMPEEVYNEIAKFLPAIANTETELGNAVGVQGLFHKPHRALYEGLKTAAKKIKKQAPSRGVLQVRDKMLYKDPLTRGVLEDLGISKTKYDPDNVEHNTLAALTLFDNINKTNLKSFDKIEGNNKELSDMEKMIYLYNAPKAVREGRAAGDLQYLDKVRSFIEKVYPQYSANINLPSLEIEEQKYGGWLDEYQKGGSISPNVAKRILQEGIVYQKELTDAQREYFSKIAGTDLYGEDLEEEEEVNEEYYPEYKKGGWLNSYK
jgi:hypothetical protein